ncbi:hypothetical protein NE237_002630 [Protea cynaroides]|uniref:Pentatricopeptide repeat-containing protein n=1 Tax=Protea cynaroides TaxID=273540 RepID=A0A9Q0KVR6_9MAGN|nr:hypothetical protein NE237_002630 [Protea cynaroides]
MPERDVPSWNAVIAGCTQNGLFTEAISLFRRMVVLADRDVRPNQVARKVFDEISDRSLTSWNFMINCLALHGQTESAIGVFEKMNGFGGVVKPDGITFVGLLNGTHGGLVEQVNSDLQDVKMTLLRFIGVDAIFGVTVGRTTNTIRYDLAPELAQKLKEVPVHPCFAFMLAFSEPLSSYAKGVISQTGLQIPSNTILTKVAEELFQEFQGTGLHIPVPLFVEAHRWGSSFLAAVIAAEQKCPYDGEKRLAIWEDFCAGPKGLARSTCVSDGVPRLIHESDAHADYGGKNWLFINLISL